MGASPTHAQRPPFHDENPTIAKLERWMPRGIGVVAVVLLLAGTVALGVIKGGHGEDFPWRAERYPQRRRQRRWLPNYLCCHHWPQTAFRKTEVLAVGGVNGRSSLLFLDAAAARPRQAGMKG